MIAGDVFNGTYTGAFSDKNVGTGKTVTITPSYTGADVSNYSVTDHATITANITAKALTVSGITASDKTYDGNDVATLNTGSVLYSGLINGDTSQAHIQEPLITRMLEQVRRLRLHQHILVLM